MKYIAFYDVEEYEYEHRSVAPSAISVVGYMAEMLGSIEPIEIISPSRTMNTRGIYRGRKTKVNENIWLIQPPSFGAKTQIGRYVAIFFTRIWLAIYLLFHIERNEKVIVYHSISTMTVVKLLKRIKKFLLIMEIREVYADVLEERGNKRKKELKYFEVADKYIFPTKILSNLINKANKPCVIAPGVYKYNVAEKRSWGDTKTHIVYAGTLQREKGGAAECVEMSKYLSKDYHIHILGFGTTKEVQEIKSLIETIKNQTQATITYDGLMRGKEFNDFIQKCDIGMSTQNAKKAFNDTSFPSKVLMYLCNGLEVVSAAIAPITESPISEYVYFYEEYTPEKIAETVKKVRIICSEEKRKVLEGLEHKLYSDLKCLCEER